MESSVSSPKPVEDEHNLDKLVAELHALKKLYGLLKKNNALPDQPTSHLLDEKSSDMLKKLLDDATQQVFDCQAKIVSCASEISESQAKSNINRSPEKSPEPAVITSPQTEPKILTNSCSIPEPAPVNDHIMNRPSPSKNMGMPSPPLRSPINLLKSIRSDSSEKGGAFPAPVPAQNHQRVEPLESLNRFSSGSTKPHRNGRRESIRSQKVGRDPIKSLHRSSINRASKFTPLADRTAEIVHRNDRLIDNDVKLARMSQSRATRYLPSADSSWSNSGSHSPAVSISCSSALSSSISRAPKKPSACRTRRKPSQIVPNDRPEKSSINRASKVTPLADLTEIVHRNDRYVDKDIEIARLNRLKERRCVSSADSSWSNSGSHTPTVSISGSKFSSSSILSVPKKPSTCRRKPSQIKPMVRIVQKTGRTDEKKSGALKRIKQSSFKHGSSRSNHLKQRGYVSSSGSSWSNSGSSSPTGSIYGSNASSSSVVSVSWAPKELSAYNTRRRKPLQIKSTVRDVRKSDRMAEKKSRAIKQIKPSRSKHGSSRSNHLKARMNVSSSGSSWSNSGSHSRSVSISGSISSSSSISWTPEKPSTYSSRRKNPSQITSMVRIVRKNNRIAEKKSTAVRQTKPSPSKHGHLISNKQSRVKTERRKAPPPPTLPPQNPRRHHLSLVTRPSALPRRPRKARVEKKEKEKQEQGKFRRLTNKLAIIFHHHHHHHHLHAGEDGDAGIKGDTSLWKHFKAVLHLGSRNGEVTVGKEKHHGYLRVMIEGLLQHLWGMRWRRRKKKSRRGSAKKRKCWAWFRRRGGVAVGGRRRVRLRLGISDSRRRIVSGSR